MIKEDGQSRSSSEEERRKRDVLTVADMSLFGFGSELTQKLAGDQIRLSELFSVPSEKKALSERVFGLKVWETDGTLPKARAYIGASIESKLVREVELIADESKRQDFFRYLESLRGKAIGRLTIEHLKPTITPKGKSARVYEEALASPDRVYGAYGTTYSIIDDTIVRVWGKNFLLAVKKSQLELAEKFRDLHMEIMRLSEHENQ